MENMFRPTSSGVRRGTEDKPVFAAGVEAPAWKRHLANSTLVNTYKDQIGDENRRAAQDAREQERRKTPRAPSWKSGIGTVRRKLDDGTEEEYDANDLLNDPEAAPFAEESLFKRDIFDTKGEIDRRSLLLQDPSRPKGLTERQREDMNLEMTLLDEKDARKQELSKRIADDDTVKAERSDHEKAIYENKMRLLEMSQGGIAGWRERRKPAPTLEGAVANHQSVNARATEFEQRAAELAAEEAELAKPVKGADLAASAPRRAEVALKREQLEADKVAFGQEREQSASEVATVAREKADELDGKKLPEKDFFRFGDTISGIWDAVKGLGVTAPAAFYQLVEGMERPDQYSESAKKAFAEADAFNQAMQAKTEANQAAGVSSSTGESIREGGQSLGFTFGSMGAQLAPQIAGTLVGAKKGAVVGAAGGAAVGAAGAGVGAAPGAAVGATGGAIAGGVAGFLKGRAVGMAAGGTAAYRMAGAMFLNESFKKIEEAKGSPLTEQESAEYYEKLLPIARDAALWEAGPEAIGNAISLRGLGKILGIGGKKTVAGAAAKGLGRKIADKAATAAGMVAGELATETITQVGQGAAEKKVDAIIEGESTDGISPDWSPESIGQAFKDVYPATLGLMFLTAGAGGVVKAGSKLTGIGDPGKDAAADSSAPTETATPAPATPERVNAEILANDPDAAPATAEEVTAARDFVGEDPADAAQGVMISREISAVEAEAAQGFADAEAQLLEAQASGDKGAVDAAEANVKKARGTAAVGARVRGALKIARAGDMSTLTDAEARSLGIKRKGDSFTPMTAKELEAEGMTRPMLDFGADDSPVILDEVLSEIRSISPSAADRIKLSETKAREAAQERFEKSKLPDQTFTVTGRNGTSLAVKAKTAEEAQSMAVSDPAWPMGEQVSTTTATNEPNTKGKAATPPVQVPEVPTGTPGTAIPVTNGGGVAGAGSAQAQGQAAVAPLTVTPSEDTPIGANAAGEALFERKDGSRYRMRNDRGDRPNGYPDFGGDLVNVSPPPPTKTAPDTAKAVLRRVTRLKKNPKLAAAIVVSDDPLVRVKATKDGKISINLKALAAEADRNGLTGKSAETWIASVIDEEIRHLAQYEAAQEQWKAEGSPGTFKAWRAAHYGAIWEQEFVAKGMAEEVRNLYGPKAFDALEPWQKAFEGMRMVSQKLATGNPTEVSLLLTNRSAAFLAHIRAALKALKDFVAGIDASPALMAEIAAMEAALATFQTNEQSNPNPRNRPQKQPAVPPTGGDVRGTEKDGDNQTPVDGATQPPRRDPAVSAPEGTLIGKRVRWVRRGESLSGVVDLELPGEGMVRVVLSQNDAKGMGTAIARVADLDIQSDTKPAETPASPAPTGPSSPNDRIFSDSYTGQRWTYGFRNRPLSLGTAPKGFIIGSEGPAQGRARHGTIQYPRELTKEEIYDFELEVMETAAPAGQPNTNNAKPTSKKKPVTQPEVLDQAEYVRLKKRLNKLVKAQDWQGVVDEATTALAYFETAGFPDQWSKWERAKEDAQQKIQRTSLVAPITTPLGQPKLDLERLSNLRQNIVDRLSNDQDIKNAIKNTPQNAPLAIKSEIGQILVDLFNDGSMEGLEYNHFDKNAGNEQWTSGIVRDVTAKVSPKAEQPKAAAPAAKPALTPGEQALKDAFKGMVDGLEAAELTPSYNQGVPPEKIGQFVGAAQTLIAEGVTTPEGLAAALDKISPALRRYSDAVWSAFRMVDPSLVATPDWAGVYRNLDNSTSTNETTPDESAPPSSLDSKSPQTGDGVEQGASGPLETEPRGETTGTGDTEQLPDNSETPDGSGDSGTVGGNAPRPSSRPSNTKRTGTKNGTKRGGKPSATGTDPGNGGTGAGVDGQPYAKPVGYRLTDPERILGAGGPKARFNRNKLALETYDQVLSEGRAPTQEEQDIIASYIGWGSFGQELFQGTWDRPNPQPAFEKESEWLRDHLGQSGWESIRDSIINAHYTDPPHVAALWKIVEHLGFKGGRTLEPSMGIGTFFGMMPDVIRANSSLTGIELDKVVGGMAQMLYPDANIRVMGYEKSATADGFYDLVIGNWPFAATGPSDSRYNALGLTLHDYFFVKALDQTRPGGLVIGITSSGTMDKKGQTARRQMANRADLIGAFRFPTGAFKGYAGTAVVTDVLILQKRDGKPESVESSGWMESVENGQGRQTFNANEYWAKNPSHVLGEMKFGHGTTQGRAGMIVERQDDYQQVLAKIQDKLPKDIYAERSEPAPEVFSSPDTGLAQNSVTWEEGAGTVPPGFYVVRGEQLQPLGDLFSWTLKDKKKTGERSDQLRQLLGIRDQVSELLRAQREGDPATESVRNKAKSLYDTFVKDHGPIRQAFMVKALDKAGDPMALALKNLEREHNGKFVPRDILLKDIMRRPEVDAKGSIEDAYAIHRNQSAKLQVNKIAEISGKTEEEVIEKLVELDQIYMLPTGEWEVGEEYLGGNVRRKLREAEDANESGVEGMERNIEALKKVQPKDVAYFEIEVQMGASWISREDYLNYVSELLSVPPENASQNFDLTRGVSGWNFKIKNRAIGNSTAATATWGTDAISFGKIFQSAMNGTTVKIYDKDSDGKSWLNEKETDLANKKIDDIRENLTNWLWSDPDRVGRLSRDYNDVKNSEVVPKRNGSHLRFEGLALTMGESEFDFRQHQKDAVWRGIMDGRMMGAHEVGTGKTFTMAGLAVEGRRLGKFRKSMVLAHNANSEAVYKDFQAAYPGGKFLYIDSLSPGDRDNAMRQIASDEWDAVIVPHSLIDRFALREETLMAIANKQIKQLESEIADELEELGISSVDINDEKEFAKATKFVKDVHTAKELVKTRLRIIKRIKDKAAKAAKENAVFFEDLGIDTIMVDEAHMFKKVALATRKQVKGLNKTESERGWMLSALTDTIKAKNSGKGVFLFTGTPLTNNLNEAYNMMQFVMDDAMADAGINGFDDWFNDFAQSVNDVELTTGGTYEPVTRLLSFINVPELARLAGRFFDVVQAKNMPEFIDRESPDGKTKGGLGRPFKTMRPVTAEMSERQKEHKLDIQQRYQNFQRLSGKAKRLAMLNGVDTPIQLETEGIKAALDMRLVDHNTPDDPNSKVNVMLNNAITHYREDEGSTQMIFMERGWNDYTDAETSVKDAEGNAILNDDGKKVKTKSRRKQFNLIRDMVEKLVAQGVDPKEIVVFSNMSLDPMADRPNDVLRKVNRVTAAVTKESLAAMMNRGEIRFAFGSTQTMGTGVNAQKQMRAMHHLDAPWTPGEFEQRNGRGHRQGNEWNTVFEYRYFTEGSHDGRRWQVLLNKVKFISRFTEMLLNAGGEGIRVLTGDGADMNEGGSDVADFEQSFSTAAGDPRILVRAKLNGDVQKLERRRDTHFQSIARASGDIDRLQTRKRQYKKSLDEFKVLISEIEEARGKDFEMEMSGKVFKDRKEADNFMAAFPSLTANDNGKVIGSYKGFPITHRLSLLVYNGKRDSNFYVTVPNGTSEVWHMKLGNLSLASIEATLRAQNRAQQNMQEEYDQIDGSIASLREMQKKPFTRQSELDTKQKALQQIEAELQRAPSPAPSWLRNGAPAGSLIYLKDGKAYDIGAHRWDQRGYWILIENENGLQPVDYREALDESGHPIFEEREFEAPAAAKDYTPKEVEELLKGNYGLVAPGKNFAFGDGWHASLAGVSNKWRISDPKGNIKGQGASAHEAYMEFMESMAEDKSPIAEEAGTERYTAGDFMFTSERYRKRDGRLATLRKISAKMQAKWDAADELPVSQQEALERINAEIAQIEKAKYDESMRGQSTSLQAAPLDRDGQDRALQASRLWSDDLTGYKQKVANLLPSEKAQMRKDTAAKFVEIYDSLPSEKEMAAVALGGIAKRGWYKRSAEALEYVFGFDAPRFAALLAAMSPQTSVESNLKNALNTWKNWVKAGRPTDRDSILRIMGESVERTEVNQMNETRLRKLAASLGVAIPAQSKVKTIAGFRMQPTTASDIAELIQTSRTQDQINRASVLGAWENNTVRALTAENPETLVISGPKVNSFMLNLRGVANEVANDAWIASFALVDQKLFAGSMTKSGPGKGPGYLAMSARTRAAAKYLTKLTGEEWTPAEVQETVWSWAKTLYELQLPAGEDRTALEILRDGELTEKRIAATPDFAILFLDEAYRKILRESGYEEQLKGLGRIHPKSARVSKPRSAREAEAASSEAVKRAQERAAKRLTTLREIRLKEASKAATGLQAAPLDREWQDRALDPKFKKRIDRLTRLIDLKYETGKLKGIEDLEAQLENLLEEIDSDMTGREVDFENEPAEDDSNDEVSWPTAEEELTQLWLEWTGAAFTSKGTPAELREEYGTFGKYVREIVGEGEPGIQTKGEGPNTLRPGMTDEQIEEAAKDAAENYKRRFANLKQATPLRADSPEWKAMSKEERMAYLLGKNDLQKIEPIKKESGNIIPLSAHFNQSPPAASGGNLQAAPLDRDDDYTPRTSEEETQSKKAIGMKRSGPLTVAAVRLKNGEITIEEYADLVDKIDPWTVKGAEAIPSADKVRLYMKSHQKTEAAAREQAENDAKRTGKASRIRAWVNAAIKIGKIYEVRIDIPTYTSSAAKGDPVYAITLHEPVKDDASSIGESVSYRAAVRIRNPKMFVRKIGGKSSIDIAAGMSKLPLATVQGEAMEIKSLPADINDPRVWTEVGYNPVRSSYFIDVRSRKSVMGGSEAIMVGPRVFVKNASYGEKAKGVVGNDGLYAAPLDQQSRINKLMDTVGTPDAEIMEEVAEQQRVFKSLGKKVVGRPDLANPGRTEEERALFDQVDEARKWHATRETFGQWIAAANKRNTPENDANLIEKVLSNAAMADNAAQTEAVDAAPAMTPEDTIHFRLMMERRFREAKGDKRKLAKNAVLRNAYRSVRAAIARSLAAGRDIFKTKAERHREVLVNLITELPVKEMKQIDARNWSSPQAREQAIEEATVKRITEFEKQFKKLGITLEEITNKEVFLSLSQNTVLKNIVKNLATVEKMAVQMMQKGAGFDAIRRRTGLPEAKIEAIRAKVEQELRDKLYAKVKAGLTLEDLRDQMKSDGLNAADLNAAAPLTEAQIQAELDRIIAVGFGIPKEIAKTSGIKPRKVKEEADDENDPQAGAKRVIRRWVDRLTADPKEKKPRAETNEMEKLIREHVKTGVEGFSDKAVALGATQEQAEIIDGEAAAERARVKESRKTPAKTSEKKEPTPEEIADRVASRWINKLATSQSDTLAWKGKDGKLTPDAIAMEALIREHVKTGVEDFIDQAVALGATPEQARVLDGEAGTERARVEQIREARKTPAKASEKKEPTPEEIADRVASRWINKLATSQSDTLAWKTPAKTNELEALIREHLKKPVEGFTGKAVALGATPEQARVLDGETATERARKEMIAKWRKDNPKPRQAKPKAAKKPHEVDWNRPEFSDGLASYVFDDAERVAIMRKVIALRDIVGAAGRVNTLTGEKRAKADVILGQIENLLKQSGTSVQEVLTGGVPDYRFDIGDSNHVAMLARTIQAMDADLIDKAQEYAFASMLSGLQTNEVNLSGGIVNSTWQATVDRAFEATINLFFNDPANASFGEVKYMIRAMGPVLSRAWSNAVATWGSETSMFEEDILNRPPDLEKMREGVTGYRSTSIGGTAGRFVRMPLRGLLAADNYVATARACVEVGAMAYRLARMEGLKPGKEGMKPGTPEFEAYIKKEVNLPGSMAWQLAAQKAYEGNFNNALPGQETPVLDAKNKFKKADMSTPMDAVGAGIRKISEGLSPKEGDKIQKKLGKALVKMMFFPFVRVPFNILKQGIDRSVNPISLVEVGALLAANLRYRDGKWTMNADGNKQRIIESIGKQLQGTMFVMLLLALGEGDDDDLEKKLLITGSRPYKDTKKGERELGYRTGLGPYEISFRGKDGKRYGFSYGRIEPFATIMGGTVDMLKNAKASNKGRITKTEALGNVFNSYVAQINEKTMLRGAADLMGLINNEKPLDRYIADRISIIMPNLIKQAVRESDGYFRETPTEFQEMVLYGIWPAGLGRPIRTDLYGAPQKKDGGAAQRIVDFTDAGATAAPKDSDRMLYNWIRQNPATEGLKSVPIPQGPSKEWTDPLTKEVKPMTAGQRAKFGEIAGIRLRAMTKGMVFNTDTPTEFDMKRFSAAIDRSREDARKILYRNPTWRAMK